MNIVSAAVIVLKGERVQSVPRDCPDVQVSGRGSENIRVVSGSASFRGIRAGPFARLNGPITEVVLQRPHLRSFPTILQVISRIVSTQEGETDRGVPR